MEQDGAENQSQPCPPALFSRPRPGEFGNKMATTLAMSPQCDFDQTGRKHLRYKVLQRQLKAIIIVTLANSTSSSIRLP